MADKTKTVEEVAEETVAPAEEPATEEVAVAEEAPAKKSSESVGAKIKEWFRKFTVKLKRQTHMIPLVVILFTSLLYLCCTATFAQVIEKNSTIPSLGIAMFVNTLLSILVLAIFLNAFPKRKKPSIVYIVAVFVVLAVIMGMDLLYLLNAQSFVNSHGGAFILNKYPEIKTAYSLLYVHMAFVGVSIVVFALLPVYKKAINKINTKKVLEENNLSEDIDTSAEV